APPGRGFHSSCPCRSRYLHPAKMSVCIRPLESAENTIVQRRNDVGIRNPRAADFHTITVDINGFVCAAGDQSDWATGRFIRIPFKLARSLRFALLAASCEEEARMHGFSRR